MKEIKIDSFSPQSGMAGTEINFRLSPDSAPKEPPRSLHEYGGLFTPLLRGGAAVAAAGATIIDNEHYTAFSIQVPHGLNEGDLYSFSMILLPSTQAETRDSYILESGRSTGFHVVPPSPPDLPNITTINPPINYRSSLWHTNIVIKGTNLDKLNPTSRPLILSQPRISLSYVRISKESATLKAVSVPKVEAGSFPIEFYTLDNKRVISIARITIKVDSNSTLSTEPPKNQ